MLKDIASIVQICFYVVGATIAILTYRSAKRGLLNTVNTEYQKRVMDQLHELSELLYKEIEDNDPKQTPYHIYKKNMSFEIIVKCMREKFTEHVEVGNDPALFTYYGPSAPLIIKRIISLRKQIESNPFIPNDILLCVVDFLDRREIAVKEASREVIEAITDVHRNMEVSSYNPDKFKKAYVDSVNMIIEAQMREKEFGREQVELEIHKIRMMIKQYLESFNPLKLRSKYHIFLRRQL